jgi:hypothetical protein
MLIQKIAGALSATLGENAFGFGAAKSRAIGCRLCFGLLSGGAFPELSQVDQISHAVLHHAFCRGGTRLQRPSRPPAVQE